jgi:hypothetical protein
MTNMVIIASKDDVRIYLTDSIYSRIDFDDLSNALKYTWSYSKGYAKSSSKGSKKSLARYLLNAQKGQIVDHINRDRLDNRRINLRFANAQQNCWNSGVKSNNQIGVKGIQFYEKTYPHNHVPANRPYLARIVVGGKNIHLGYFSSLEAAVAARKLAEQKYFGEFASCSNEKINLNSNEILQKERISLRKMNSKNTTGIRGVYKTKYKSGLERYCANIWLKIEGKMKHVHLGTFETEHEAFIARQEAEAKYWGMNNNVKY